MSHYCTHCFVENESTEENLRRDNKATDVRRIRRGGVRTGLVAGSVWKTRMKIDEVNGGIKVHKGDETFEESTVKLRRSSMGRGMVSGKRRTWKADSFDGNDKKRIQKGKRNSDPHKSSDEQCEGVSVSTDGSKRSPVQTRRLKSEGTSATVIASVNEFDRSPSQTRKQTSETPKGTGESGKENGESGEAADKKSPMQLKIAKSDPVKIDGSDCKTYQNSNGLSKSKSESAEVLEESEKRTDDGIVGEVENIPTIDNEKTESEETCKQFGVCQEKVTPSSTDAVVGSSLKMVENDGDVASEEFHERDGVEEIETDTERHDFDIKEINIPETKNDVTEVKKLNQVSEKPPSISLAPERSTPVTAHSIIHQSFSKINSTSYAEKCQSFQQTNSKLQSLVDLVMWRDVSRSAFVFMMGSFTIVSSSYVKDVNVSVISAISYVGLVYLAAIFLCRSLVCRSVIDEGDTRYLLGEEEATWILNLVLPYLNEFLSKFRALFSGDPATTMKLAVLLFVLARSGSSMSIWNMVKLGFFGVFTIPKFCSLYSAQLTAHANFWARRFQDAWNSCTQKKAVGIGIFILVWNLSSVVARIWAAFMLYVGFRYYQQNLAKVNGVGSEMETDAVPVVHDYQETTVLLQKPTGRQRQWRRSIINVKHQGSTKTKKGY